MMAFKFVDPILGHFIWTFPGKPNSLHKTPVGTRAERVEAFERGIVIYTHESETLLRWEEFVVMTFASARRGRRFLMGRLRRLVLQDFAERRYDLSCVADVYGLHELIRHQQGLPPYSRLRWWAFRNRVEDVRGNQ